MSKLILARADALMHRLRPGSHEANDIPVLTDAVVTGDDIPTLLAYEPAQPTVLLPDETTPESADDNSKKPDCVLFNELADELVKRIHAHLAAELPTIVDNCLRESLADPAIITRLRSRDQGNRMNDFVVAHPK